MPQPGLIIAATQQVGPAGGGGEPALEPLVSIDFKTATYSIGGVAKTLAEVIENNTGFSDYWGDTYEVSHVVADVGLRVQNVAVSAPALTAAAMAELLPVVTGFTVVATFDITPGGVQSCSVRLELLQSPDGDIQTDVLMDDDAANMRLRIDDNNDLAVSDDFASTGAGQQKVAYTMIGGATPAAAASRNGRPIISGPMIDPATADVLGFRIEAKAGATVVLEKIEFFEPQPDGDLPTLSALA